RISHRVRPGFGFQFLVALRITHGHLRCPGRSKQVAVLAADTIRTHNLNRMRASSEGPGR
ncbi:MAG TPA: hypothetical protein VK117_09705, partial [Pyrinomonadaceae bacterium]|nr:hypothetical protein [Pyrinomonadaceae bacterium]